MTDDVKDGLSVGKRPSFMLRFAVFYIVKGRVLQINPACDDLSIL